MDPGDWIFAGEEYKTCAEFPKAYWLRLCEEWATDYAEIASSRAAARQIRELAQLDTRNVMDFAPPRSCHIRIVSTAVVVLGSMR